MYSINMLPHYLAVQTNFSFHRGLFSPEDWAAALRRRDCTVAGITDTNNLCGMVRWLQACKKNSLKPVIGCRLGADGVDPLFAWCLNRDGLHRLNQLISFQSQKHNGQAWNLLEDLVENGWEGLCLATASSSQLNRLATRTTQQLRSLRLFRQPTTTSVQPARQPGLRPLALQPLVWQADGDEPFYRLLRAIDLCCPVEQLPATEKLDPATRLATPAESGPFWETLPEAVEENHRLAEECDTESLLSKTFVFPAFQGLSEPRAHRRLRELCAEGILRRFGRSTPPIQARLKYELDIIRTKGFSSYFLVVHDIVKRFPRTCGRGSAAASIVSYLLGLTHVDPLKHNLFFERFLNEGRQDPPDIDIDFPWDEREKALDYVFTRYPGHSALVADHVTFARKSTLREPAKALGYPESEIKRLLEARKYGRDELIPEELRLFAQRITGFPRYLGTHPGGVVITPRPILHYTHIQISPLGRPVIAWEKDATEDAGLVKIDLLGNRSLGVLRDALAQLKPVLPSNLTWENFSPGEDPGTLRQLSSGHTLGIFYVESPASRLLLQKMERADFEHLVVASSIIRPAANAWIKAYVDRLHGKPWEPLDPDLEDTLCETFGIMVYQEDVSRVAMAVAGFDAVQADKLRKLLSKKNRTEQLDSLKEAFYNGGQSRGRTRPVLDKIWNMVESFAGYSFCKAHSASYAQVSMRLAWIKHYHPAVFYTAVINNGGGFYAQTVYINALRRIGVKVLPPCINRSQREFTLEGPLTAPPGEQALRVGLGRLKEISSQCLDKILTDRQTGGTFTDFQDFLGRIRPTPTDLRVLIRSGTLDALAQGLTRPQMFWISQVSGPAPARLLFSSRPAIPAAISDYSPATKLRDEVETMGQIISVHPLDLFLDRAHRLARGLNLPPITPSERLAGFADRTVTVAGLFVTCKPVGTKARQAMAFISLEDHQGMIECVAFPDTWNNVEKTLDQGFAFLASGVVREDQKSYILELGNLWSLHKQAG